MTTFDDRESAFENKFAHDADMLFKAESMRNRMVAAWASELLGKTSEDAAQYVKDIIRADFEAPGPEDVIRKLIADLDGKVDEETIRTKVQELTSQAQRQVLEGDPS
ncbi:MAG: DUF1476 domain-containing protein [Pseudomonadota bacterium]